MALHRKQRRPGRTLTSCNHLLKIRLDQLLTDRNLVPNIDAARSMIGAGEVYVNDTLSDKVGSLFPSSAEIRLKNKIRYVSRGGLKLEKGIAEFNLEVNNRVCMDIGASTGGFTDCLVQHGAKKVYAVDVAYGQLAWKIRQDPKVIVVERFNARKITADILEQGDFLHLAVIDASFISLTKLLTPLLPLFKQTVQILALIKPQFELAKDDIISGGVVVDPELHEKAIEKIRTHAKRLNLYPAGITKSPIRGPKGNTEFLMLLSSK